MAEDFNARIEITTNGVQAAEQLRKVREELGKVSEGIGKLGKGQALGVIGKQMEGLPTSKVSEKWAVLNKEQEKSLAHLPRLRYALYDVSSSMATLSAALLGGIAASVTFSAKFESAFTAVERTTMTTDAALKMLRNQLEALSTQVPISFESLASIAALGSQLGIASNDLIGFTKTISEFSATTNVSTDEAAKGFGRLGELLGVLPKDYNNLASAIAYVGVKSAATESEILRTSTGIAGVAKAAGLTTDFVIGLSGALASLGVPAEQSRGALTRVFQEINRAAAEGGPQLDAFAKVLGVTASQAKNLAETNIQAFFTQMLQGMSGMSSGELTQALDSINLADIRVTNTLSRLSKNVDFTNELLGYSATEFKNGAFLAYAYGKTVDDLASRFQILQNSLAALGAAIGDALAPFAKDAVNTLINLVNVLTEVAKTPAGKTLVTINAIGATLVGTITAMVASLALFGASMAAARTALNEMGVAAARANIIIGTLGKTFKALPWIAVTAGILDIAGAIYAMSQASKDVSQTFGNFVTDTTGLAEAIAADTAAVQANSALAQSYTALQGVTNTTSDAQKAYAETIRNTASVLGVDVPAAYDTANNAINTNTQYLGENSQAWLRNSLLGSQAFQDLINGAVDYGGVLENVFISSDTFSNVSQELETLRFDFSRFSAAIAKDGERGGKQYFIDLATQARDSGAITEGVFQAIVSGVENGTGSLAQLIDMMLGFTDAANVVAGSANTASDALDNLAWSAEFTGKKFKKVTTPISNTAKEVKTLTDYANDLRNTFQRAFDIRWQATLDADAIADSWQQLGDRIREARNRIFDLTATRDKLEYFLSIAVKAGDTMRINELTAELANANQDLADATDNASTELNGNSSAARRNRRELLGIIQSNSQYLASLAAQGVSQKKLKEIARQLRDDFLAQAQALGYNTDEAQQMLATFGDFEQIINDMPRDITVDANTDPAQQALNEFVAKANSTKASVKVDYVETDAYKKWKRGQALQVSLDEKKALYAQLMKQHNYSGADKVALAMIKIANALATGSYASGGYTGRGGKFEPAGVVHKGEYVVPKHMVNQSTGLPYADALGRLVAGSAPAAPSYAAGGFVGGGMMVSLSPEDRALMRSIGASGDIVVAVDSREIARANARGAKLVTAEGGYLV